MPPRSPQRLYQALSDFRYRLAGFLRFSAAESRRHGLTAAQYLLLLHLRGLRDRDWATVGELAARLHASRHGTTALVGRCVRRGLVTKSRSDTDRRVVAVRLTAVGRRLVSRLADRHRHELRSLRAVLRVTDVS